METKYIDADKLKKLIDEKWKELADKGVKDGGGKYENEIYTYLSVLRLIDSLQQEQPIQLNTLTWKDINDIERIINNVHYKFRNGIGEKSFGEEVLERFREERDEQEQPEVDLEKEE